MNDSSGNTKNEQLQFSEVWGYLLKGEEKQIHGNEPFTHIYYVGASLDSRGRLKASIERPDIRLANGFRPALHIVIAELTNYSLMHFCLTKKYQVRDLLIDDIIRLSEKFEGVQIDFEAVSTGDTDEFLDFIKTLRGKLNANKMLSIALPARKRFVSDAYQYQLIAPLVDRIVIMAYDEHWSSSKPGPVASLPWCRDIVHYAKSVIPKDKIIMGLPLYGRAWQDKKLQRAIRHHQVEEIISSKKNLITRTDEIGPRFEYSEQVNVTVYYDDVLSIVNKLIAYKAEDITAVSFWRVGQGPKGLWDRLVVDKM